MSLSISKEMLTPVIEQQVKAMMTTILGGQEQIVDTIIKRILETKVDSNGRPNSYSDGKTYFEWLLKDEITKAVKELIAEEIKTKTSAIKNAIKKQMKTEEGSSKIADALLNGLNGTLQNSWSSKLTIEIEPKENNDLIIQNVNYPQAKDLWVSLNQHL